MTCPLMLDVVVVFGMKMTNGTVSLYIRTNPPVSASTAIGTSAVEQYQEDRSLYGVSMNTKLGDWAIGAELSYRPKDSVAIDPTVPLAGPYTFFGDPRFGTGTSFLKDGFKDEKKYQAHLTGFYLLPQSITSALGAAVKPLRRRGLLDRAFCDEIRLQMCVYP